MFAHYINLEFCETIVNFLEWHAVRYPNCPNLSVAALQRIAATLELDRPETQVALRTSLILSKLRFEAAVNNVAGHESLPHLSLQGAPIDVLMQEVKALPQFQAKYFFFLVDEYENLDAYQQRVLNTLIKHCGELYSFKVGVRELGFREHSTLNEAEQLIHPADYKRIDITGELAGRFDEFAAKVCRRRLSRVFGAEAPVPDPRVLLPGLSAEEEAYRLGVREVVSFVVMELKSNRKFGVRFGAWLSEVDSLEVFALKARAEAEGISTEEKLLSILGDRGKWGEQYDNYKYAYLFKIRRGKRGIRKYFAGWRAFCLLSGSNIRYLLELVDQALKWTSRPGA